MPSPNAPKSQIAPRFDSCIFSFVRDMAAMTMCCINAHLEITLTDYLTVLLNMGQSVFVTGFLKGRIVSNFEGHFRKLEYSFL